MGSIARIRNGAPIARRLAALLLAAVAGCGETVVSEREESIARSILPLLQAGDYASLEALLDPAIRQAGPRAQLEAMAALIPAGAPTEVERLSYKARGTWTLGSGVRQVELVHRYRFGDKSVIVTVALAGGPDQSVVTTAHVLPVDEAALVANAFTFAGKGIRHYLVLALAIAVPSFIVITLVVCIRTRVPKRKWAWLVIILFGVGQVSLNWTTGEYRFSPLSVVILGANFIQPLQGPLILNVAVPVGAIVFWIRRRKWLPAP
jgi:hypothetical protein